MEMDRDIIIEGRVEWDRHRSYLCFLLALPVLVVRFVVKDCVVHEEEV